MAVPAARAEARTRITFNPEMLTVHEPAALALVTCVAPVKGITANAKKFVLLRLPSKSRTVPVKLPVITIDAGPKLDCEVTETQFVATEQSAPDVEIDPVT